MLTVGSTPARVHLWIPGYGRLTFTERGVIQLMSAFGAHYVLIARSDGRGSSRPPA